MAMSKRNLMGTLFNDREGLLHWKPRSATRLEELLTSLRKLARGRPPYTREELVKWVERRDKAAHRTDAELVEVFRNVHWCPRELGGVR